MRLNAIEKKAKQIGITNTWKFSKKELIKEIQKKEGFTACFSSGFKNNCVQMTCCWREDCLK